jgi:hypothetical protein
MPQVKQASKQKRTTKAAAVKVLGAAGLGNWSRLSEQKIRVDKWSLCRG